MTTHPAVTVESSPPRDALPTDAPNRGTDQRGRRSGPPRRPLTRRARRRTLMWSVGLGGFLVVTVAVCVGLGPVVVRPSTVIAVLGDRLGLPAPQVWTTAERTIIWDIRAPRVLLGAVVGAGLAVCGAALQAVVRNILADPYILGISSGASTGAAGAILFGFAAGAGAYALPVGAFLGALLASALVFGLARSQGQVTAIRLLLAGIAIGYALSACTSFLIFASDSAEGSRTVMFWLLGSLVLARWDGLLALVVGAVLLSIVLIALWSRRLDALSIGEDTARAVGIAPTAARAQVLVVVSLCTGAAVAAAGAIGFIGLVVPHLARRLVGASHARLLPVAALLGAILLVWADAGARVLMEPRELPVGIITAAIGSPLLIVLIRRMFATTP